jgi:hypothetical protein
MKTLFKVVAGVALFVNAANIVAMQSAYNRALESGDWDTISMMESWFGQRPAEMATSVGNQAIHRAAKAGDYDVLHSLLEDTTPAERQALLTDKNIDGKTAAQLARDYGHAWIAEWLEKQL